jgi:hypothetical protein
MPLPFRPAVAAVCGLIAIRRPAFMPMAVALSAPVVWFNSLSVLVAIMPAMNLDAVSAVPECVPPRADADPPTAVAFSRTVG